MLCIKDKSTTTLLLKHECNRQTNSAEMELACGKYAVV